MRAEVVVESVGPATWDRSMRALAAGGRLVVCGGTSGQKVELDLPRLFFKQIEVIGSTMGGYGEFAEVTRLVEQGLPVSVDAVLALDGVPRRPGPPRGRRPAGQDRPDPRVGSRAWTWPSSRSACGPRSRLGPTCSSTLSHQIHEHPETNYEEHFAHDLLTGIARGRGPGGASARPTGSTPRSWRGRARDGPRHRRAAASTTPCPASATRAGTTSSPPRGSAPAWPPRPLADEVGGRVVVLGTPAEEGGGGKILMARAGRVRRASTPPSWCTPPATTSRHGRDRRAGAHRHLHRPGRPRRRVPARGPQRPRRRRARLPQRRRAAAAHPPRRADPRGVPRGGGQAEHRPRPRRHRVDGALAQHRHPRAAEGAGRRVPRGGGDRRGLRGRHRVEVGRLRRHARQRGDGRPLRRQRGRARPDRRRARREAAGRGQHRHGQRELPRAVDPPDDRGGTVGRADPHPRVRRASPGHRAATRPSSTGAIALAWTVADLWLGDGVLDAAASRVRRHHRAASARRSSGPRSRRCGGA